MNIELLLTRGVEEVIEREHLQKRLEAGEKLRVKLGIDPTASDLHLGHTVVLRKLRQFQDAGHTGVLIIGDYTALIGDPSGRNESRPQLTPEQVKINMEHYLAQAGKVLDMSHIEIRYNSEWYSKKSAMFLMELTSKFTIARQLERDDFQNRLKDGRDISTLEILYPLLQGYDSIEVKADVELGGTDQKFNLLMGRKVQKRYGLSEQDIITMKLIEGLDGVKKMSKSLGNYIGIQDKPDEMFAKIMSIPDGLMAKYYELLTDLDFDPAMAPKMAKEKLAKTIVEQYHGTLAAQNATAAFDATFSKGKVPEEPQAIEAEGLAISAAIIQAIGGSKTEAKRLIDDGAVKINEQKTTEWDSVVHRGDVIQIGPHRFFKIA